MMTNLHPDWMTRAGAAAAAAAAAAAGFVANPYAIAAACSPYYSSVDRNPFSYYGKIIVRLSANPAQNCLNPLLIAFASLVQFTSVTSILFIFL